MRMNQALKGRHRFLADYAKACVALSGLNLSSILKPRVPEPAVRAPPPWALLHRAFSALGIRLSLTRMPAGAAQKACVALAPLGCLYAQGSGARCACSSTLVFAASRLRRFLLRHL